MQRFQMFQPRNPPGPEDTFAGCPRQTPGRLRTPHSSTGMGREGCNNDRNRKQRGLIPGPERKH
eukprot:10651272-Lingulodinium_polyedra.AAC.1